MRRLRPFHFTALAAWMFALASFQVLCGQSVVFVSPSTKGLLTMSCAEGSLSSIEEIHYLAAVHYLADHLCQQSRIEGGVGIWKGQAENSGMIDGCPNDRARELGSLLARYYLQKEALVFERNPAGKTSLVSFQASQPLGVIAIMMAQAKVSGATVIPRGNDHLLVIVTTDPVEHERSLTLYSLLHGHALSEEPGTTELIGNEDRAKARDIFTDVLAHAPTDVQQLGKDMYSEQFSELGIEATPAH
jgi:hypothetical protein